MGDDRLWGVMPAAGSGQRFGDAVPKQYLVLAGRPVIQHSIDALFAAGVGAIAVALSADDTHWNNTKAASDARVVSLTGGAQRADSVLAALDALAEKAASDDWVLVHDAARPCVDPADIQQLIAAAAAHPVGGLLALPVADTLKRCAADGTVRESVDRSELWSAQTPQMFRFGLLRQSLKAALEAGHSITDEAMALELAGHKPLVIHGSADNIKITVPADLRLAEFIFQERAG